LVKKVDNPNNSENKILTIPNLMSFFRLLLIPVFVWLYSFEGLYYHALAVIVLSSFTDILDGKIARRFHMVSNLGRVLDPIADKFTQGIVFICIALRYPQLFIVVGVLLLKELGMILLGLICIKKCGKVNSAKWYGKLCTVIMTAAIMALLIFPYFPNASVNAIVIICTIACVFSLTMYTFFYLNLFREADGKERLKFSYRTLANVVVIILVVTVIVLAIIYKDQITLEGILNYSPQSPFLAACFMILLFALKSLSVIVFIGLLYAACGLMFPLPIAILVAAIGTAVAVSIPYFIGKRLGASAADKIAEKHKTIAKLRELRRGNDFFFSMLLRALGFLPCDIVSYYCGAASVPYLTYVVSSVIGYVPQMVVFALMGSSINDVTSPTFLIALGVEILMILLMSGVFWLYKKKREKS